MLPSDPSAPPPAPSALPALQSEEQLFEAPREEAAHRSLLQRWRAHAASLLRLAVLVALFAPVVLSAPFIGDAVGLSRARWLRLLRCVLLRGRQWRCAVSLHAWRGGCDPWGGLSWQAQAAVSFTAAYGTRPPALSCPQVDAGARGPRVHQVGPVGGHAARPRPPRLLRRAGAAAHAGGLRCCSCWPLWVGCETRECTCGSELRRRG